jgi:hypothetical protein
MEVDNYYAGIDEDDDDENDAPKAVPLRDDTVVYNNKSDRRAD